jgi:hypothetical protein
MAEAGFRQGRRAFLNKKLAWPAGLLLRRGLSARSYYNPTDILGWNSGQNVMAIEASS